MVIAVLAGAVAVGLVAWAFGDKIRYENERFKASHERGMNPMPELDVPDDWEPPATAAPTHQSDHGEDVWHDPES
jgi:hypothetical protein